MTLLGNALQHITGLDIACALVVICLATFSFKKKGQQELPLPPGPKSLPLIGNLLDLPEGFEGYHLAKYNDKYGPICSYTVLGQTFVIISDKQIAFDLLEKRSSIYSSRPPFTFGGEMVGFDRWLTGVIPYDETFKMHRKFIRGTIGTKTALVRSEHLKELEARRFLFRMIEKPDEMMDNIRTLMASVILKISHGYTVGPEGIDPFVTLAEEVMGVAFSESCAYGNCIVDLIPPLKYLPEWLPGMGFKRQARAWAGSVKAFSDKPFAFVKHQMAIGQAISSFASEALEKSNQEEINLIKCAASAMYAGGADTTVSGLGTAFLAMARNPNVVKRAQEEIDRVVGADRLPSFSDRPNLPYIDAIVKEALRWENVVGINMPHLCAEEDVYMGYRIPKGAVLVTNLWQMTHDPESYHEPFAFKPERFLGENGRPVEQDPRSLVFGFGRRICPGKEFADHILWIAIAMSISVLSISKAKDDAGNDIEPLYEYVPGLVRHPKPFNCRILPRSEKAASLIRSISEEYPLEKGDGDVLKNL